VRTGPATRESKKLSTGSTQTSSSRLHASPSKTLSVRATSASAIRRSSYSRPASFNPWTCRARYGPTCPWTSSRDCHASTTSL
jgi:hypothetical protein